MNKGLRVFLVACTHVSYRISKEILDVHVIRFKLIGLCYAMNLLHACKRLSASAVMCPHNPDLEM